MIAEIAEEEKKEQRHPGLIVSRWPFKDFRGWKNCPRFQKPPSLQLAALTHRALLLSMTSLNLLDQLCTSHTKLYAHTNIHTDAYGLSYAFYLTSNNNSVRAAFAKSQCSQNKASLK